METKSELCLQIRMVDFFDGYNSRNISDRAKLAAFRMVYCTKSTVFNTLRAGSSKFHVVPGESWFQSKPLNFFSFYDLAIETEP